MGNESLYNERIKETIDTYDSFCNLINRRLEPDGSFLTDVILIARKKTII